MPHKLQYNVRIRFKSVFSFRRNTSKYGADVLSSGRVFQSLRPATANERSPTVTSRDRGMTRGVWRPETASWCDVWNAVQQIRQIPRCSAVNTSYTSSSYTTNDIWRYWLESSHVSMLRWNRLDLSFLLRSFSIKPFLGKVWPYVISVDKIHAYEKSARRRLKRCALAVKAEPKNFAPPQTPLIPGGAGRI